MSNIYIKKNNEGNYVYIDAESTITPLKSEDDWIELPTTSEIPAYDEYTQKITLSVDETVTPLAATFTVDELELDRQKQVLKNKNKHEYIKNVVMEIALNSLYPDVDPEMDVAAINAPRAALIAKCAQIDAATTAEALVALR
jgi:hypothetical protein